MGNFYDKPPKTGPNPYTRSGEPPPKMQLVGSKDAPAHRVHNPMSLELHMADQRVRAAGLSSAEREWRKKYLKDLNLHPDEPIHVDAVHRQMNPIRMLYRTPWDKIYEHFLRPSFGTYYGTLFRNVIPKSIIWYFGACTIYYYFKYENKNWQRLHGAHSFADREFNKLYKDGYSEDDLRLGLDRPDFYNYYDPDFVHYIQTADIGETKRPW